MLLTLQGGRMPTRSRAMALYQAARLRDWSVDDVVREADSPGLDEEWQEWAWLLTSSSVYAEQTGLVVAASLLADVDDVSARLCLATAVSDEAKHMEVFGRVAQVLGGAVSPVRAEAAGAYESLASLDDWMARFLVHTMLEGFAMDEFSIFMSALRGSPIETVYEHVRGDERAHVAMGLDFLSARLPDPAFADTRASMKELEAFAFRVGGVDDDFFVHLAGITGRPAHVFRADFIRRHRRRLRRALGPAHSWEGGASLDQ